MGELLVRMEALLTRFRNPLLQCTIFQPEDIRKLYLRYGKSGINYTRGAIQDFIQGNSNPRTTIKQTGCLNQNLGR